MCNIKILKYDVGYQKTRGKNKREKNEDIRLENI